MILIVTNIRAECLVAWTARRDGTVHACLDALATVAEVVEKVVYELARFLLPLAQELFRLLLVLAHLLLETIDVVL